MSNSQKLSLRWDPTWYAGPHLLWQTQCISSLLVWEHSSLTNTSHTKWHWNNERWHQGNNYNYSPVERLSLLLLSNPSHAHPDKHACTFFELNFTAFLNFVLTNGDWRRISAFVCFHMPELTVDSPFIKVTFAAVWSPWKLQSSLIPPSSKEQWFDISFFWCLLIKHEWGFLYKLNNNFLYNSHDETTEATGVSMSAEPA